MLRIPYSPRSLWAVVGAMMVACVSACASLPDLGGLGAVAAPEEAPQGPTVLGTRGEISAQATRSLLGRRWKNSYADTAVLARMEEMATSKPLIAGNRLTLLYDGPQTMAAMMAAIQRATNHINLETYIFDEDAVGTAFADLLIEKQRAGVAVHVMVDAVGTISTPAPFLQRMRDAGIQLMEFNPINPLKLVGPWEPNHRDHRKLLVVDGRVAFTGGVNISSTYANSSLFRSKSRAHAKTGWRDTHIQVEGPAVAALQWEFLNNWAQQNAPSLADRDFFPALAPQGEQVLRVVASEPDGDQEIYKSYILGIRLAKTSVHITSAYFVPDPQILQSLKDAAVRGVDVKLVLPGMKENDLAYFAGHAYFAEMLDHGIRLYQLQQSVLHAKTAVIDALWSTVGSANIDTRSFLHNYELNLVVYDPQLGKAMEDAFQEDLRLSTEVDPRTWAARPRTDKIKEWFARQFGYWL
jgi:cardiolipin synthase